MSFESVNVYIGSHRTSLRLEPEMRAALNEVARYEGCTIHNICTLVNLKKQSNYSLAAALRVYLMLYYRAGYVPSESQGINKEGFKQFCSKPRKTGT